MCWQAQSDRRRYYQLTSGDLVDHPGPGASGSAQASEIEGVISAFLGHPCQIQCMLEENHLVKEALRMGAQITNVEER